MFPLKLCTVDLEIRELERSTINLVPEMVFMEGDTVLVQYIISRWSLQLRQGPIHLTFQNKKNYMKELK